MGTRGLGWFPSSPGPAPQHPHAGHVPSSSTQKKRDLLILCLLSSEARLGNNAPRPASRGAAAQHHAGAAACAVIHRGCSALSQWVCRNRGPGTPVAPAGFSRGAVQLKLLEDSPRGGWSSVHRGVSTCSSTTPIFAMGMGERCWDPAGKTPSRHPWVPYCHPGEELPKARADLELEGDFLSRGRVWSRSDGCEQGAQLPVPPEHRAVPMVFPAGQGALSHPSCAVRPEGLGRVPSSLGLGIFAHAQQCHPAGNPHSRFLLALWPGDGTVARMELRQGEVGW